ncbi:MAG: leucyl aminopeptidase [Proteobacteria bacterium]|nr:MAG: leucyl aminopeptidase [Pseudomonadota bacterium]
MPRAGTNMVELFREELELCGVGPGERVAVLSEGDQLRDYAEAFLTAARALGADVEDVNLRSDGAKSASERIAHLGKNSLTGDRAAMETLKAADLVVDHMLLLFSREQIEIQEAGTRMLLVVEPFEVLERLFPSEDLRRRVEAGEARLAKARTLRFTNAAGTDVTYQLGERPILTEYGYTDTPGRWDHWPGGFLSTIGAKGRGEGRVVMDRGDIVYPHKRMLGEPVEFVVRDGAVADIRGGAEAAELRKFMESYQDPRAYALSHIGWGLNDRCEWTVERPGIGMDGRAYYGNVLFSLGPDTEFGGDNDTECHLDLPMRRCSLWLDDELIVKDGEVIPEDMRAPGR